MIEERLIFSELPNIDCYLSILGLVFPESATDFQRSALTLAHLMASLRDYVLKGHEVPPALICLALHLADIMHDNLSKQR